MFRTAGTEAPPAPREVSDETVRSLRRYGAFLRLFGGIWAGVSLLLAFIFGMLASATHLPATGLSLVGLSLFAGVVLYAIGWRQKARAIAVFRDGVEASAETLSVERNYKVRMNGQHPWRVRYRFQANGESYEAATHYWTIRAPTTKPGSRIVVLHDPKGPERSVIWSSLDPTEEPNDRRVAARARAELGPRGARIAAANDLEDEASEEFIDEDEVKLKQRS